jgi:phosphatidylinositol-3-phosphatase
MITSDPTATEPRSAFRCEECGAGLAHDQRYCVECGTRRGPLPAEIAGLIGAIHEQGPNPDLPQGTPLADSLSGDRNSTPSAPLGFVMPGPRAAAAAVMGMLGFGVIIGSLVGGTSVATLASAPLIVVGLNHPATTPTTVTVPAPAAGGSDGGGAAASAGAAAVGGAAAAPQNAEASASPSTSPTTTTGTDTTSAGFNGLPPVKHVFMIVLSDRGFTQSFGAPSSGYLSGALRRQGELIQNYYAVAGAPLANEIALVSGQGPTVQTATDCPTFSRIKEPSKGARGQVLGSGCAYPTSTKTLAGQFTSAGDTWKAYVQGVPPSAKSACHVPKAGSKVPQTAASKKAYVAWHNPFLYFGALTDGSACHKDEVGLGQLKTDLKSDSSTPALAYIIPAPCSDGSEAPCKRNAKPGLAGANQFLKTVVPEIKKSPAYKNGGMIAITFDQAPQTGQYADPSACCSSPATYPNLRGLPPGTPVVPAGAMGTAAPGSTTTGVTDATTTGTDTNTGVTDTTTTGTDTTATGTTTTNPVSLGSGETTPTGGGGQVGLLLISPYVKANSIDVVDYFNHFSLLASIESLFGLHHLGYAGAPGLPVFSAGVFNKYAG